MTAAQTRWRAQGDTIIDTAAGQPPVRFSCTDHPGPRSAAKAAARELADAANLAAAVDAAVGDLVASLLPEHLRRTWTVIVDRHRAGLQPFTWRELGAELGIAPGSARDRVLTLAERGLAEVIPGQARNYRVLIPALNAA